MAKTKNKWTIMVYLAGDNDLTAFCVSLLQQLEAVNYRDDICVLACFDSSTPWPKGSRYFRINCRHRPVEKVIDWEMHNDLIQPNGRGRGRNNGDENRFTRPPVAEGLKRFIDWSMKEHADSDKFMLVLFGHGPAVIGQNFLVAENPSSYLRIEDLREILSGCFNEHKLDVLMFQNCVMNNIEVAYELRDQAKLIIGSQGLVLATGWPYEKIISAVVKYAEAEPDVIAQEILKLCARNMLDFSVMDRSSEQAVCNLEKLRKSNIMAEIERLVAVLIEGLSFTMEEDKRKLRYPAFCDLVRLARLDAQAYWGEKFVDLYDFCGRLLKKCNQAVRDHDQFLKQLELKENYEPKLRKSDLVRIAEEIIPRCDNIRRAVKEMVPHSYFIGSDLQYSHGLSIYFPWTLPGAPYIPTRLENGDYRLDTAFDVYQTGFSFVKDTGWAKFLNAFFEATLRNVRRTRRSFTPVAESASLSEGLVVEHFEPQAEFLTGPEIKSSPDTGRADMSTSIKNYPRRNYLSPPDRDRVIKSVRVLKRGMKDYDPKSPPVSSWGWNIQGLVAEVIQTAERKPDGPGDNGDSKTASGKDSLTQAVSQQ